MGHPDGAHTHGSGGSGLGMVVLVIVAAALFGPAIAAAVAELLHVLVIVLAALAGLTLAGVVALAAFHVHRWRVGGTVRRPLPAPPWQRAVQGTPASRAVQAPRDQRPAIEQHVHHHWHGISPEAVAAIIRQQEDQ